MSEDYKITIFRRFLKTSIDQVLTNSWFIAFSLGIVAYFIIDYSPNPYLFEKVKQNPDSGLGWEAFTYFADLNSDGIQERFYFASQKDGNSHSVVYLTGSYPLDQWNIIGKLNLYTTGYFVGDYDQDGLKEIACFSLRDHEIIVNIIEPFADSNQHFINNLVIDSIRHSEFVPQLFITDARFVDLNQDGYDEFLFSFSSGMAIQPRGIYALDIKSNRLLKSPYIGIGLYRPMIEDFDLDGKLELVCENNASYNYMNGGIAYPDTSTWFTVLNSQLQFKVPPVSMAGKFSDLAPLKLKEGNREKYYVFLKSMVNSTVYHQLFRFNPDFSISPQDTLDFPDSFIFSAVFHSISGRYNLFYDIENAVFFTPSDGFTKKLVRSGNISQQIPAYNYQVGPERFEYSFLYLGKPQRLVFLNSNGQRLADTEIEPNDVYLYISWMGTVNGRYRLLLFGPTSSYTYEIYRNPWQYLQYLILVGLVIGAYLFITLIRVIQKKQIVRLENTRKEVLELQLKAVRNQLDPHFTFNALNTLSGLSLTGDKNGVDHFINHFSRLLRTHLQTSDKILVPLKEEIEFVVSYVELQRIRFENSFCLVLDIPKSVDLGRQIPKMMIQTHVENAIKHGIRGLGHGDSRTHGNREGRVLVEIREENESLVIVVEDNGVGRGNSKVSVFESTGKGLLALQKIRESIRELYGVRMSQVIVDLFNDEGRAAGTRVVMRVEE